MTAAIQKVSSPRPTPKMGRDEPELEQAAVCKPKAASSSAPRQGAKGNPVDGIAARGKTRAPTVK